MARKRLGAEQLLRLSEFVALNPDRIVPRFLLAYHLLVVGRPDVAYAQLTEVQRRRPLVSRPS